MPFTHLPLGSIASRIPSHFTELFSFDEAELETVQVGSEDVPIRLVGFLYGQAHGEKRNGQSAPDLAQVDR